MADQTPEAHQRRAEVIPLRPEGRVGNEVVQDAEIVDEEPRPTYNTRTIPPVSIPHVREAMARGTEVAVRASVPAAKTASSAIARHTLYIAAGVAVIRHRRKDAKTTDPYVRAMHAAEAAGDWEAVERWADRIERAKNDRHKRRMDWVRSPKEIAKALVIATTTVPLVLLTIGVAMAINEGSFAAIADPFEAVATAVATAVWFVTAYGVLLAGGGTVGLLWYLNRLGKRHGEKHVPQWVRADAEPVDDAARILVTADGIVRALQHLPIPALSRAFKDGWMPTFALIPTREGEGAFKGYRAVFDLPMGVTPAMLSDKRDVLARNLNRNPIEVWPTDDGQKKGGRPGFVDLYVADSGVMDKPTPAYPLLTDGAADVFAGVPIGITQRGEQVLMPLVGSNFVIGGLPGQGKSNAMRVIMLGAALDPLAELRVHVFAANGDFDVYAPRLSRYVKGASVEHAEAATEHLRELHAEIARREGRLAEVGAKKLTRAISAKHADLRPLVVAFSECHELFGDDEVGEEAAELATDVIKRGRKTGVIVGFDTQSARAGAMPPKVVENVGVNCCFYVKTWRNNDGFLGDGSFAAGIRATELRFNVDRGTMMTTGITDEQFELLRTYFIEVDDDRGWDAAEDVIRRAMEIVDPATPVQGSRPQRVVGSEESRDLLADVADVLRGEAKVKTVDVAARLRELAPGYRPYKGLDGTRVKELLGDAGVRVTMSDGYPVVRPERVAEAIAKRSATDE